MTLIDEFLGLRDEQLKLAQDYEKEASYEMAYVALWSVIEQTVKRVEEKRKYRELREKVVAWYEFFENELITKSPAPIKAFDLDVKTIPDLITIHKSLGEAPAISKLLNSQSGSGSTKYRERRNAIAHHAQKFKDASIYSDYKETALAAIAELEDKIKGLK
ncbi:hypothetical protein [Acinetobacter parvus]|uniref:hypothetical protein n=1 Tax=Acinetobacter parvus TaxID=134533 RepID=UPI003919AC58